MCRGAVGTKLLCRMRVLLVKAGLSVARMCFLEKRHQNTRRRSRVVDPVDLEPAEGLGLLGESWGRVGLNRRARLKLTTRVLHKVLCRPVLHLMPYI